MKVVGIDYGEKRVGMAISNASESMVLALPLYEMQGDGNDAARIAGIAEEQGAEEIVVGLPINMNDTLGPSAQTVLAFAEELKLFSSVTVNTWDERLSSEEAKGKLRDIELSRKKKRDLVNTVAAQVILESYLEARRKQ